MNLNEALENSKKYLASAGALASIERDPYWPKWDSPWWHMRLMHEMGMANEIPKAAILKMVEVLKTHYLEIFPIKNEDMPLGTDPYRKVACHCAVGSMYQVLFDAGVDVDKDLPWMRSWILRYQLPDGGLNCDEKAYTKEDPKSSIVSTVNCLEAILFCTKRNLTSSELNFLEKGAEYLLRHKLYRRISNGNVIDDAWLEIKFPRFYEYDFLRGFYFLVKWSKHSGQSLPQDLVNEVNTLVNRQLSSKGIILKRYNFFDKRSYNPNSDGSWSWGNASEFNLHKAVSGDGIICEPLTRQWNEVKQ